MFCLVHRTHSALGSDSDTWMPSETQQTFFAQLGHTGEPPSDRELLDELIAAGIRDFLARLSEERGRADAAAAQAKQLEPYRQRTVELEAEPEEARAAHQQACDAEQQVRDERDYLRTMLERPRSRKQTGSLRLERRLRDVKR